RPPPKPAFDSPMNRTPSAANRMVLHSDTRATVGSPAQKAIRGTWRAPHHQKQWKIRLASTDGIASNQCCSAASRMLCAMGLAHQGMSGITSREANRGERGDKKQKPVSQTLLL